MPAFRFEVPRIRRVQMSPFTTALVTITAGILVAGVVALVIAFGVVILAVAGVVGLLATGWHHLRRYLGQSSPASASSDDGIPEIQKTHHYKVIQEAEIISIEDSPKAD